MEKEKRFANNDTCAENGHACIQGSRACLLCGKNVCRVSANDNVWQSLLEFRRDK